MIENIIKEKISEMWNPNDLAYQSNDIVEKIHKVNNMKDHIQESTQDIIQELRDAVMGNDGEITVEFEDGEEIHLDVDIVKYVLENFEQDQINFAFESWDNLVEILDDVFDVEYLDGESNE